MALLGNKKAKRAGCLLVPRLGRIRLGMLSSLRPLVGLSEESSSDEKDP